MFNYGAYCFDKVAQKYFGEVWDLNRTNAFALECTRAEPGSEKELEVKGYIGCLVLDERVVNKIIDAFGDMMKSEDGMDRGEDGRHVGDDGESGSWEQLVKEDL